MIWQNRREVVVGLNLGDLVAGDGVKEWIEQIVGSYPDAIFTLIDDATVYTEGNYHSAMETLYEGAAPAIIVVMLNTVSLLGITLVTGILVDDAIVEIENIVRHIHMGKPAFEASEEAASEIDLTVIAISFTIVSVFAPVSFMSGIAGQYFKRFGITVAVAVLFSLLVARLITPMMAAYFLRDGIEPESEEDGALMRGDLRILRWTLHNRTVTLLLGLRIFAGSIYSTTLLPSEFVPAADTGRSSISVELPPGSTLAETRKVSQDITEILRDIPEVENIFVNGGGGSSINKATINLNLGSKGNRERSLFEIEDQVAALLQGVPDVRLHVLNENGTRDILISVLGGGADQYHPDRDPRRQRRQRRQRRKHRQIQCG